MVVVVGAAEASRFDLLLFLEFALIAAWRQPSEEEAAPCCCCCCAAAAAADVPRESADVSNVFPPPPIPAPPPNPPPPGVRDRGAAHPTGDLGEGEGEYGGGIPAPRAAAAAAAAAAVVAAAFLRTARMGIAEWWSEEESS